MNTTLRDVIMTPQDPKEKDVEINETIGVLLQEVLDEKNIEINDFEFETLVENLRKIVDYKKTTDEDVKNYFKAFLTITGR